MKALFQKIFGKTEPTLVGEAALIEEIRAKLKAPQEEESRKPLFVDGSYVGHVTIPTFYTIMSPGTSGSRTQQAFTSGEASQSYTHNCSNSCDSGSGFGVFTLGLAAGVLLFD